MPPQRLRQLGWLVAIAVAYLYVFPYFPRIQSANELPRVYLVKAMADHGTFAIDRGVARWGGTADVSPYKGHQYSNKAPGSSMLVVPVYFAVAKVAGEPSLAATLWMSRLVAGVIPALLFLWLLWGFLERYAPDPAVRRLTLVAYGLGSMAMTYAVLYYSHQLSAICIAAAYIYAQDVIDEKRGLRAMVAVGLLAGAAPLVDYQAAFAGVPLFIYFIVRMWRRRGLPHALAIAAACAAVPIAILLAYHAACFGSPLRTGYDTSETFAHFHQQGFLGMTKLRWTAFRGSLWLPDNGLLVLSPWVLLAIPGGVALWRRGERSLVITIASIVVVYILFIASITFWRGGWGVGPRYITVMLPFLLPLVAAALQEWRAKPVVLGVVAGAIVSAVAIYTLSQLTFPYWPDSLRNPFVEVTLRLLVNNAVAPNLGSALGVTGIVGALPYVIAVAATLGWSLYQIGGWRTLALASLVGAAIIMLFVVVAPRTGPHAERAYVNTVYPAVTK